MHKREKKGYECERGMEQCGVIKYLSAIKKDPGCLEWPNCTGLSSYFKQLKLHKCV